jgi:hypothetical protein
VVEFTETAMRKFCRNPKCRMKLPTPTSNEREAFCCRGCHSAYYRKHCLVCDGAIVQPKRGERLICKKAACIKAFRESSTIYRYQGSQTAESISETHDFIDSKQALKPDRGWFIVAGPKLTPSQFRCAIVGAREAVESFADVNMSHWKAAKAGERGYRLPENTFSDVGESVAVRKLLRQFIVPTSPFLKTCRYRTSCYGNRHRSRRPHDTPPVYARPWRVLRQSALIWINAGRKKIQRGPYVLFAATTYFIP